MMKHWKRITAGFLAACCFGGMVVPASPLTGIIAQAATTMTPEAFLASATDTSNVELYDGSSAAKSFQMNGRTYYQGMVLSASNSKHLGTAQFNTENVDKISFTLGHLDGATYRSETLAIYYDDKREEEIAVTSLMPLKDYTFDVSSASSVRFELSGSAYYDNDLTSYCLGDFKINGQKVAKSHAVPTYETPESFIHSAFNRNNYSVYDGSEKANNFNMNGRTYYQGIVLSASNDKHSGFAQINTENVDKISFTLGHLDGATLRDETLTIYYNDKKEEEIAVSSMMPLKVYSFDVSSADYVRFHLSGSAYYDNDMTSYGLGDFQIDAQKVARKNAVPTYDTPESFMHSAFNRNNYAVYDGSEKTNNYNMNGRTYYQGIVLSSSNKNHPGYAQINTENVDKISFTLGHLDGTNLRDETLTIYYDDKKEEEIALSWQMTLKNYTFDVSSVSYVRFYLSGSAYYDNDMTSYGLGDFQINAQKVARKNAIPTYETPESFIHSAFNRSNYAVYDGSEKANNFNMNG